MALVHGDCYGGAALATHLDQLLDEFTPLPNVLMSKSVRRGTISTPVTHNLLLHAIESMLGLPWLVGTGDLRAASGL